MFDIRKWIPGYIEIRSVYYQEIYLDIMEQIATINSIINEFFSMGDTMEAMKLRLKIIWLIKLFEKKYMQQGCKYPKYINDKIKDIYICRHVIDM